MNTNLLNFNAPAMAAYFAEIGEKPFRARQVLRWLHQSGAQDFATMTDLAKSLRARLESSCELPLPTILRDHTSTDGTRKWLTDVGNGNAIETVFIPEDNRGTLCVSSQAGCAVNCRFCSTGHQGFNRNLTSGEIISQLWWANHALGYYASDHPKTLRKITNVVMMGMGEPLLNYSALIPALDLMLDDNAYGLSRRRVTVSTSGVVPMMDRLSQDCPVALAVSLHAPTDALRDELVPLNKKYPLRELMNACQRYLPHAPRDFITFEYVMLRGVNDSIAQARQLVDLVKHVPCKFNLIPFNPFPESGLNVSARDQVRAFGEVLINAGIVTTIRKTRGEDIDAACGQLAGQVQDRTRRNARAAEQELKFTPRPNGQNIVSFEQMQAQIEALAKTNEGVSR